DCLLLEKTQQIGGTAATSAGSLWIPGNAQGRRAGFEDDADSAQLYLQTLQGESARSEAVKAYLKDGQSIIDYLEQHSDVQFVAAGLHPDYNDMPGASIKGRVIVPKPFDG